MSDPARVGPRPAATLHELLGPEVSQSALVKLNAARLEEVLLRHEQGWRRWLAAEHGGRGPANDMPSRATLERAIPVLRAMVEARMALEKVESQLAVQIRSQIQGRRAEVRAAHTAHALVRTDLPVLDLGIGLPFPPDPGQVEEARRLVERRYQEMGYLGRDQSYAWTPGAFPLVALKDDEVVSTLSVIVDAERLPLEEVFPAEVAALRGRGLRVVEVGAFASHPESPSKLQTHSTLTLVDVALESFRRTSNHDLALIAVHPHHAGFYERRIGARRVTSDVRAHPKVEDAPAVLLSVSREASARAMHQEVELVAKIVAACLD